jgi:multicomponent K+:H+ antiporter subunit G
MTYASDLPAWAALVTSMLLLVGAFLAFTGSLGLLRLRTFYERVHAPTLGTTLGLGSVLLASMLFFSVLQSRPVLHEVLIAVFMVVTTPVTFLLLARAALYRDRREGNDEVPPRPSPLLHSATPADPAVPSSQRNGQRT